MPTPKIDSEADSEELRLMYSWDLLFLCIDKITNGF